MPKLTETLLVEILEAFAGSEKVPSREPINALATLSGKFKDNIEERYEEIFKDIHGKDKDPLGPSSILYS